MHLPPGGGPGAHRHDFKESFTVLEGETQAVFRGQAVTVQEGETLHIPASGPRIFTSRSLTTCALAGQDESSGG